MIEFDIMDLGARERLYARVVKEVQYSTGLINFMRRFKSFCRRWEYGFIGSVAQMVERSLSMREALGSMPSFSIFQFFVAWPRC